MRCLLYGILLFINFSCQKNSPQRIESFLSKLNILTLKKNIIQSNILNISTTRTSEGGPYIPKEAINCKQMGCDIVPLKQQGVGANTTEKRSPILKYEPGHPDANKEGYVAYPNINLDEEKIKLNRINTAIQFLLKEMPVSPHYFFSVEAQDVLKKFLAVNDGETLSTFAYRFILRSHD